MKQIKRTKHWKDKYKSGKGGKKKPKDFAGRGLQCTHTALHEGRRK